MVARVPSPARRRLRAALAAGLLVVGVVLVPVAVVAAWGRWVVLDTERYTETVAPLAGDELVRAAVRDRLVAAAVEAADVEVTADRLVALLLGDRDAPGLDAALRVAASTVEEWLVAQVTDAVDDVLASPAFARVWENANRAAHAELLAVLRGDETVLVHVSDGGAVGIDLASVADALGAEMTARGLRAVRGDVGGLEISLVEAESAQRLRGAYTAVDVAARALAPGCVLALVAGGLLARRRSRAVALASTGVAAAVGLTYLLLLATRSRFVAGATGSGGARRAVFDQVSGSLRLMLALVLVCALGVAAGAWLRARRDRGPAAPDGPVVTP